MRADLPSCATNHRQPTKHTRLFCDDPSCRGRFECAAINVGGYDSWRHSAAASISAQLCRREVAERRSAFSMAKTGRAVRILRAVAFALILPAAHDADIQKAICHVWEKAVRHGASSLASHARFCRQTQSAQNTHRVFANACFVLADNATCRSEFVITAANNPKSPADGS